MTCPAAWVLAVGLRIGIATAYQNTGACEAASDVYAHFDACPVPKR